MAELGVAGGRCADAVARLKRDVAANLVVFGSGVLVRSLMRHKLVDEFVLLTHPLVLGTGRRLFEQPGDCAALELVESAVTETGVSIGVYRPAEAK